MAVTRKEVDEPIIDVVWYIHGSHLVQQGRMLNSVKGLTEIQCDDHYIRVAREQFRNRLENGDKSSSRGSSWTESTLISTAQLIGWLKNCWIDELSDNDALEHSAQDGSD